MENHLCRCSLVLNWVGLTILMGVGLMGVGLSGCEESRDQSQARLAEMPYNLDIIQEELLNRFAALRTVRRKTDGGQSTAEQGRASSEGPGGNPFTLEKIADDIVHKLGTIETQSVSDNIDELERRISADNKLSPSDLQKLMTALRDAAKKVPSPPP